MLKRDTFSNLFNQAMPKSKQDCLKPRRSSNGAKNKNNNNNDNNSNNRQAFHCSRGISSLVMLAPRQEKMCEGAKPASCKFTFTKFRAQVISTKQIHFLLLASSADKTTAC